MPEQKLPRARVVTLGCKVNQYESEAIAERLCSLGFDAGVAAETDNGGPAADLYIINTCAVTAEAARKSRQIIRRAHRANPSAPIVVCGCYSQSSPEAAAAIDGVSVVIGNRDKLRAAEAAADAYFHGAGGAPRVLAKRDDIDSVDVIEPMSISSAPRTRAYVKICDGCDGKCAYCLIPSMRGHVRSRAISDIMREVAALAASGCREIVLTGIETASFGRDTGESLISLLRAASETNGVERIRLSSLEPTVITDEFIRAAASLPALVPHYHLSLQSGCSRTLASMRRKYTAESAMARISALRTAIPDVMFTTDIIVGFPGETDEDFEETLEFARRARFLHMHVFPFSPRRGTAAESMPDQIAPEIKRARSARLIALGDDIARELVEDYAARTPAAGVLFESDERGMHAGRTANFIEVYTPKSGVAPGEIRKVRILRAAGPALYGEVI